MLDKNMFWIDERYCAERLVSHIYGYCRCCRKTHEIPLENLTQHQQGPKWGDCTSIWSGATMSYVSMKRFKCPNCGKVMTSSNTHILNSGDTYPNLLEYSIKRKGRKISYKASCIFYSINPFRGKLRTRIYDYRIVFDTENGQTYLFAIRDSYKKKIFSAGLINASYGMVTPAYDKYYRDWRNYTTDRIRLKLFSLIQSMYAKDGIEIKAAISSAPNLLDLSSLSLINRFPGMDPNFVTKHKAFFSSAQDKVNPAFREIKNKNIERQKDVLSLFGVKPEHRKKSLLREVYLSSSYLFNYYYFKSIKSIDLLMKCLEYLRNKKSYGYSKKDGQAFISFLKALTKNFGENIAVNKLLDSNLYLFIDTANMLRALRASKVKVSLNGSVKEIHDRVMHEFRRINSKNRIIKYEPAALELNSVIDGYEFVMAKDTDELRLVGNLLSICVGSYADRAVTKQTMIAFLKKNDEYIACFELSPTGKELRQAKTRFNHHPDGEIREVILRWIEQNEIKINTGDISRTKRRDLAA